MSIVDDRVSLLKFLSFGIFATLLHRPMNFQLIGIWNGNLCVHVSSYMKYGSYCHCGICMKLNEWGFMTINDNFRLVDVISRLGLQKASVLRHMSSVFQPILEKGIVDHSILHKALMEYFSIADQVLDLLLPSYVL